MYVRELHVQNVKLLRDVRVSFLRNGQPRMWTALIGENGLGKTTLLQAIALAASGRDRANQLGNVPSFPDIRHPGLHARMEASFGFGRQGHASREYPGLSERPADPPVVQSFLSLAPGHNTFVGGSAYATPGQYPDAVAEVRSRGVAGWCVAGYGVDRRLPEPFFGPKMSDPPFQRLAPLFDKGPIVGTGFADLFGAEPRGLEYARRLQQALLQHADLLPRVDALELRGRGGVTSAETLIEAHRFEFAVGSQRIKVPATWLSQGYQATIAWIADVVGQQFWDSGVAPENQDMEGLVLIDEIDLHLHPKWQKGLIQALKATFPRLQFVVTTHSPMVLPGLERDEILRVDLDEQGDFHIRGADETPAGMTGSELYEEFFGLAERFPAELGEALRRYGFLSGNPYRTDQEEGEMQRLRERLREADLLPGWTPVPREQRP
jgi:hypothetical protein